MATSSYRTIYILCHAHSRTGGPEALHQLGLALRDLGHDARMVYAEGDISPVSLPGLVRFPDIVDPMPAAYQHYDVPRTFEVLDEPGNAMVIGELHLDMLQYLRGISPYIWWLSIDNGLRAVRAFGGFEAVRLARVRHLCQSYYAMSYLLDKNIQGLPLFDYTVSPHMIGPIAGSDRSRLDRILYPARGKWFTGWLQRWAPDLPWLEIVDFSASEVWNLFSTSKIYVDFGSHPGKDRMPREAAIAGCCIVTGQRGSAGNSFDIPIFAGYKFQDSRLQIPCIVRAIRSILNDYQNRIGDFEAYREIIAGERLEFVTQVEKVFGRSQLVDYPHGPAR